ncbi:hypothetical protein EON67_03645 [archaeon]|nr:MAG: hypothetical protein EON67_03645 [archaeon]
MAESCAVAVCAWPCEGRAGVSEATFANARAHTAPRTPPPPERARVCVCVCVCAPGVATLK